MNHANLNPIIQYAIDLTIIHANEAAVKLVNLGIEQARGLSIHQFWNTCIDTKAHSKYLLDVINNNAADQSFENYDCHATPIFDAVGKIGGVLAEYTFLTEKKNSVQDSLFEAIFNQSPYSISINENPSAIYLGANKVHEQFYGYATTELIGKTPGEINIWADNKPKEMFDLFNTQSSVIDYPINMRKKDGTIIPALLTNKLIHVNNSDYIVTFSREYSQEFLLQQKLKQSEIFLRTALEASNDGFFDWHIDGNGPTYANKKLHDILGYQLGEVEINFATWGAHIYQADQAVMSQGTQQIISGNSDEGNIRYRMLRKNESIPFWVHHHYKVAEKDQAGKPTRLIGTITDLTEQLLIEDELRDQKELLESVFNSIDEGIWDFHVSKKLLTINPRCSDLLNIEESQVSYAGFKTLCMKYIHPYDLMAMEPQFLELLSGKSKFFLAT